MSRRVGSLAAWAAAIVVLVAGGLGAYAYARDYNLHRGFTTIPKLPRAGTGRLLDVHFQSSALHRRADYLVYLPPGYTTRRRYPVDYLLHGMPGQPHVFITIANLDVRLDNLLSTGAVRPMILVFPDGRIHGSEFSDSEWANTPSGDFESYVINVMNDVDGRFSALPYRQDRVIGGFSAGAFGAMNIGLHHLDDFANIQAWSGYYTETHTGVFAHASPATLAYNSPYDDVLRDAAQIHREGLRVYMFIGRDDGSAPQQAPMAARLRALGVQVGTAMYPGGHDWGVWYPRLNPMLMRASHDMGSPPPFGAAEHASRIVAPRPASGVARHFGRARHPGRRRRGHHRRGAHHRGRRRPALRHRGRRHRGRGHRGRGHRARALAAPASGAAPTPPGHVHHSRGSPPIASAAILLALLCIALIAVVVERRRPRDGRAGRWFSLPLMVVAAVLGSVCAVGLIYGMRSQTLLGVGPRVADALPLLALAHFAGQPLARVLVACLLAGAAVSVALRAIPASIRVTAMALITALTLLLASDASDALADNLRFFDVVEHRTPGVGPWIETLALVIALLLPELVARFVAALPRAAPSRPDAGEAHEEHRLVRH